MIRKNQRFLSLINAITDSILILLSYLFATWFWLDVLKNTENNIALIQSWRQDIGIAALIYSLAMVLFLAIFKLYNPSRTRRIRREFLIILEANALGILVIGAILFLFRLQDFSRGVLAIFFLTSSALLSVKRVVIRLTMASARRKGYHQKMVIVAGTGALAEKYAESIRKEQYIGIDILGYVGTRREGLKGKYLGDIDAIEPFLKNFDIDEVIVALEPEETELVKPVIALCEKNGNRVAVIPFYNDIIPSSPSIEIVGDIKLISLRSNPLDNLGYAFIKRAFDIFASLFLMLLLSPLLITAMIGIKLSSPGPVFFKQQRVGRNKHLFLMYKLRSMRVNAAQDTAWSTNDDPRRTRFGSLLRKFSVDELPQLINVLRGEMSLIGPRPEIPFYVEQFAKDIPLYMVKHQIRPGMTGWAQVNGYRGDTSIEKRIEYDIWYIENWSIGLDARIMLMTLFGAWYNSENLARPKKD